MPFTPATKRSMLQSVGVDLVSLHNGDPGPDGTANEISGGGYERKSASFVLDGDGAAARLLTADLSFSGPVNQPITHAGIWRTLGPIFRGAEELTGGTAFNSDGEYTLKAGATRLSLAD